jgi:hypothetical protein
MSRVLKLVLGVTLSLQAGAARSQPPGSPPLPAQPSTAAPPPGPAAPASDVDIRLRQKSTLSPQDMVNQAREYRQRIEDINHQLQNLIEQARQTKDVIRLNCLLDKAAQIKADRSIIDGAIQSLSEAVQRQDEGASVHEYTRITIIHQKAQVLAGEAQACVGEDLSYVGATRVDVDVSGVPPGDFTSPTLPPPIIDRPPAASPRL